MCSLLLRLRLQQWFWIFLLVVALDWTNRRHHSCRSFFTSSSSSSTGRFVVNALNLPESSQNELSRVGEGNVLQLTTPVTENTTTELDA